MSVLALLAAVGCGDSSSAGEPPVVTEHVTVTVTTPELPPASTTRMPAASTTKRPAVPLHSAASARPRVRVAELGRSVQGRPIIGRIIGNRSAPRTVLVVGCVHGSEPAGRAITRRLRTAKPPAGTVWWLVDEFNPDGCRANTRQNANGVDLNRNSPWRWQPIESKGGTYYSGTGPLSEPESRAINGLIRRIRPDVSIWYHQHAALVDSSSGGDIALEQRYADAVGLPLKDYGVFPGSIVTWQNRTYPDDTSFVVELPAGALSRSSIANHVRAIRALS